MKKITMFVKTRMVGSKMEEVIEFDDDATEQDIQDFYEEWVWNQLDAGWSEQAER